MTLEDVKTPQSKAVREGYQIIKIQKKYGLLPNWGRGGSPRVNKKPNLKFANVFFFNEHEESF